MSVFVPVGGVYSVRKGSKKTQVFSAKMPKDDKNDAQKRKDPDNNPDMENDSDDTEISKKKPKSKQPISFSFE